MKVEASLIKRIFAE